ncbi:hypothetical protein H5410_040895 [Solanum commersonii]|uniref:Uncharacterized protein n=1 Tax=Solanum commersonii TaxID=4109 RepID=A0A9J5XRG3_SOLCO|nr:hypothetical protein H5410_040895 [Solanum commersonii]
MENRDEATTNGGTPLQEAHIRNKTDSNQNVQTKQAGNRENNKSTGIDSMRPIPTNPNNLSIDCDVEVE